MDAYDFGDKNIAMVREIFRREHQERKKKKEGRNTKKAQGSRDMKVDHQEKAIKKKY